MDWEKARYFMVEQQIRPWDVLNQAVLNLLFKVKREDFVPADKHDWALVDMELPLPAGRKMWHPKMEARVVQELTLRPTDRVLEIGCGSGYLTALLAQQAEQVYAIDIEPELVAMAQANLKKAGIKNARVEQGDASLGWSKAAPYDVIVVGCALPFVPDELRAQLAIGGRLLAVVGEAPIMSATLITRKTDAGFDSSKLFETVLPELDNARQAAKFVF